MLQPATAAAVHDSPWLGEHVTDHLGRPATVRRVYDVDGEHVAYLTSSLPAAEDGEAVCGEHTALLSAPGRPAAVPDFPGKLAELGRLEEAAHSRGATEDDIARFRAAARALEPYDRAEDHLRQALFDQAQPGDRVYLTGKDWYATIADHDDNPLRDFPRLTLRVRLDDTVLRAHPHLLARFPGGIVNLSTLRMWPTLDLA